MIININEMYDELCREMVAIAEAKNSDYANEQDKWLNFRLSEIMGVPAWQGALIRLGDKLSRQSSFQRKGTYAVKDEGFKDTCIDAANYAMITLGLYTEEDYDNKADVSLGDLIGNAMSGINDEPKELEMLAAGKGKLVWDYILDETAGLYRMMGLKIRNDTLTNQDMIDFCSEIASNSVLAYCYWKKESRVAEGAEIPKTTVKGPWTSTS